MSFSGWTIKKKLFLGLSVILMILVLITGYLVFSTFAIQKRTRSIEKEEFSSILMLSSLYRLGLDIEVLGEHGDGEDDAQDFLKDIEIKANKFLIILGELKETGQGKEEFVSRLQEVEVKFQSFYWQVKRMSQEGPLASNQVNQMLQELIRRESQDIIDSLEFLVDEHAAEVTMSLAEVDDSARRVRDVTSVLSIFAVMIGGGILFSLTSMIVDPIRYLVGAVKILSGGDLNYRIPVIADNELGRLAREINGMAENLNRHMVSNDFLEKVLATMKDPLLIVKTDGEILRVNSAVTRIFGYKEKELVGQDLAILFPDQDTEIRKNLAVLGVEATFQDVELQGFSKEGRAMSFLFSGAVISGHNEEQTQSVWAGKDISMLKNIQGSLADAIKSLRQKEREQESVFAQLLEANRKIQETKEQLIQSEKLSAVGQLSSGVAHEIKNPLAIIILGTEFLKSKLNTPDEDIQKYLKMIVDAAERANKVVVELLKFSRSTGLNKRAVDVHSLIEEAIALIDNKAKLKDVRYIKEFGYQGKEPVVDAILMEQVFVNLFSNAVDAFDQQGTITVRTAVKEDGRYLHITVEDNGPGMPPEVAKRIFEPFFTTKEVGTGTGLGLSTVFMIMEKHGGVITVNSEVGKGTVFELVLPIDAGEQGGQ